MATPNYTVNYNDKRFTAVNDEKKQALKENEQVYDSIISQSDKYYNDQIKAAQDWQKTQTDLQNEQTDFAIEKIEQQKEQAYKDYLKEQSGAYVDWQKQSGSYGANAEKMASQGLIGTGYSESSQVSMYNAYQIRVSTARETFNKAVLNYENSMTEARLQNKSILAEIAYKSLQNQLQLALDGFQYKNTLVLDKAQKKREIDSTYYSRYQDVLSQINTENALAESARQYNADLAEKQRQYNLSLEQQKKEFTEKKRQFDVEHGSSSVGSSKKTSGSFGSAQISKGASISGSSSAPVDMSSVTALGLGPISATALNSLIEQGYVKEYEENGKIKFAYTNYGNVHKQDAKAVINGKTSSSKKLSTGSKSKDFLNRNK